MLTTTKNYDFTEGIKEADVAQSALITLGHIKPAKDSVLFVQENTVKHNGHEVKFYFYKLEAKDTDTYLGKNERMAAVGFVVNNNKIDALAYRYVTPIALANEDDAAKAIEGIIDEAFNGHHSRATFGSSEGNDETVVEEYVDY